MNKGKYLLTGTILSWILGYVGADRFYRGEVVIGLLKLITLGGFGIWYFVDAIIWTSELGNFDRSDQSA
jgi:TM2 domain-containing membrane protein YozV